jgi:hypothetical protein
MACSPGSRRSASSCSRSPACSHDRDCPASPHCATREQRHAFCGSAEGALAVSEAREVELRGLNGEADVLRDEGETYANKLREAGVPVTAIRYHGKRCSLRWGRAVSAAVRSWRCSSADGATTCYHQPAGEGANGRERGLPLEREVRARKRKLGSPREQSTSWGQESPAGRGALPPFQRG